MPEPTSPADGPWWNQRVPSVVVFLVALSLIGVLTLVVARGVVEVLPEVGKDQLGEDDWTAPLGVHIGGGFQVARVPDCAAGAFTRLVLWDADSEPYWEVSGPPTPLTSFVVGVTPEGFTEEVAYDDPPPGAVLRLVAFRRNGGPVGIRYFESKLRENRVVAGHPLQQFTITGFQTAEVCGDDQEGTTVTSEGDAPGVGDPGASSTTTTPADPTEVDPGTEDPGVEDTVVEDPVVEDPVVEDTVVDDPGIDETTTVGE